MTLQERSLESSIDGIQSIEEKTHHEEKVHAQERREDGAHHTRGR